ncbi:MAG: hypothetical protein WCH34_19360 [Bacteroidota bacterium]
MVTLDFKGPFQLSDFKNRNLGQFTGVYIWGFKGLIPNSPDTIVPYYVGITADSKKYLNKTILGRHIPNICSPTSTYMRLSIDYMCEFFKDEPCGGFKPFPLKQTNYKSKPNWDVNCDLWSYNDYQYAIAYLHNRYFVPGASEPYDISIVSGLYGSSNDYLTTEINKDNFWIWYAEVEKESTDYVNFKNNNNFQPKDKTKVDLRNFEVFESFVKHLLIGRTIGKHEGTSSNLASYQNSIKVIGGNNNGNTIFKNQSDPNFIGSFLGNY